MDSVVPPFPQWIQNIRCDINNLLQHFKNVYIHRAKIAGLFSQLKTLLDSGLKATQFPNTPPNPSQSQKLRKLIKLISQIRDLVNTLDKSKAIDSIKKENPGDIVVRITDFRTQFGENLVSLNICKESPFSFSQAQMNHDHASDSKSIVELIDQYLKDNSSLDEKEKTVILKRRKEYEEIVQNFIQYAQENDEKEEEGKERIVPPNELKQKIEPILKYKVLHDDFMLQKKIGNGAFADVYMGVNKKTNKVVAIKQLNVKEFTDESLEMYLREVKIMGDLNHFAVLPFMGVTVIPPYWIITEFMSGGCLFNRIHGKTNQLDGTKKTIIALGIAYAMSYVHKKKYIHRDLKSLNILLNEDDYPFVCDFGISRIISNLTMTGTLGTPQWMAPEVIQAQHYDGKADVYSYGIILWELLMNQVPFRGLQQVQVMMSVVNRKNRPYIPPDMSGNLTKFIKACWDNDPKVRPTFDAIVAAFESGKINYPGTNQDTVNAYRSRFASVKAKPDLPELPKKPPKVSQADILVALLGQLKKPETAGDAIQTISSQLAGKKSQEFAKKLTHDAKIMEQLVKACDFCNTSQMAWSIIKIFTALSAIQNAIKPIIVQKVIGIFVRFGTTQMKEILSFFDLNMALLLDIKLNGTLLDKFSGFLRSSDVSLRIQATDLLVLLVEKKVYAKPESLKETLAQIIKNIQATTTPKLVISSLKILKNLLPLKELVPIFFERDLFKSTATLFLSKFEDDEIYIEASLLFTNLIDLLKSNAKYALKEEDIRLSISTLTTASSIMNAKVLPNYIIALSSLLKLKSFYSVIAKYSKNEISESFEAFLSNCNSDEALILCLKICYALLCDHETQSKLAVIARNSYIKLMNNKSSDVASLAAACLIQSTLDMTTILNDDVSSFLKKALSTSNSSMELNALRLCGAFSSSVEGAQFLESQKISELLAKYISNIKNYDKKDNRQMKNKLAVMAISSYSKIFPTSKVTLDLIDDFIGMLDQKDLITYTSSFLACASIHPSGATAMAKRFDELVKCLDDINKSTVADGKDEGDAQKVYSIYQLVRALDRVVTSPEAMDSVGNIKSITTIYNDALFHFNDVLFSPYLELVSNLSCTENGKQALPQSDIISSLNTKMESLKKDDFRKYTILRIIARYSNK